MDKPRNNHEMVTIRVNSEQKKKLKQLANTAGKNISNYMRDAALSPTLDSAKYEFYQSINADILHLKKFQYIATRLLLLLGSKTLGSDEKIMKFFNECVQDSETRFAERSE